MGAAERSQLQGMLRSRCDAIAEQWYQAIATTSYVSLTAAEVRQRLLGLTEQLVALLCSEPFERDKAQAIGASLARLHYIEPEALGRTQEVLGRQLVEGLPADQVVALQPRLAELLAGLATGFLRQAREMILTEQEQVRKALVASLHQTEEALRRAYDDVERKVRERTFELRVANESLRREIAERKQVEKALRASEERYHSLFDRVPVGLFRVSPEGRFLEVNPALVQILGYPDRESLLAVKVADLCVDSEAQPRGMALAADDGVMRGFQTQLRRADGMVIWVEAVATAVRDADGQVVYYEGSLEDITERKRIEQTKDSLVRDVSHELKAPLAKMQMSVNMLAEMVRGTTMDRGKLITLSEIITNNVRRLQETVNGILDLSVLESGYVEYQRTEVWPEALIFQAIQDMRPLAEAKGLEVVAELPDGLPQVEGDPSKLLRVLINLLGNSVKFSDRGKIIISAREKGREVEFAVSDSGCGILPENLDRVFDRFFQEKARYPGAGVGLSICKAIVEAHGGRIWAESEGKGRGATFKFTLPIVGAEE